MDLAAIAFDTGTLGNVGLKSNVDKALAILNGAAPLDILGGDKVRTFYGNIVNPWGEGVTIDRHAYDIVTGKQIGRASCRERVLRLV